MLMVLLSMLAEELLMAFLGLEHSILNDKDENTMKNTNLSDFEKIIIDTILENAKKQNPTLNILKLQFLNLSVQKRTYTNVGFFTDFQFKKNNLSLGRDINMEIGSIHVEMENLKFGAGFILYIRNGLIATLEGYCYDESWPRDERIKAIYKIKENGELEPIG